MQTAPAVTKMADSAIAAVKSNACHDTSGDPHYFSASSSSPNNIHVDTTSLPSRTTALENEHLVIPRTPQPAHLSERRLPPHDPLFSSPAATSNECCAPSANTRSQQETGKMGLTKQQRIGILLGIDGVFFLIELTVGTSRDFHT